LEELAKEKNKRFFTFHQLKRPYIILKWAESSNHKMGGKSGDKIKISNQYSDRLVHKWRSEEAGILIGTETAKLDNPELTNRLWKGKTPIRIVLDNELRLPDYLNIFDRKAPTIILNRKKEMQSGELLFKKINGEQTDIPSILSSLHSLHVLSILVEGGAKLLRSFIETELWDEIRIITNTEMVIEGGIPSPDFKKAKHLKTENFVSDRISYYRNTHIIRV
jgi:diaminohydroxyphosphoribosylaminopyrimidine deaminase/5-amino-6-(5-phosphoribosylamino)uracil reductase